MAGAEDRAPGTGEQRAELPTSEVLEALEHAYHPQCPTPMHPADFVVKHFKLDGHEGLRDTRLDDPASVLAHLLAEHPDATIAALETLLTSDEAERAGMEAGCDEAERLGYGSELGYVEAAAISQKGIAAYRSAACRSLRPNTPKED